MCILDYSICKRKLPSGKRSQNTLAHQTRPFAKFTLTFTFLTKRVDQIVGPHSEQLPRLQPLLGFHPRCLPPPPFPSLDSEKKQYLTALMLVYIRDETIPKCKYSVTPPYDYLAIRPSHLYNHDASVKKTRNQGLKREL